MMNLLLRIRYYLIRTLFPKRLKNYSPIDKKGRELTFCEEFVGKSWNTPGARWKVGGSHLYHPKRLQVWYGEPMLRDGKGVFFCKHNPRTLWAYHFQEYITFPYETSRLTSLQKQKYGRFECRMTLPKEPFSWSAFWLWGPPWPPEIDVIETYGRKSGKDHRIMEINLHYGDRVNHKQMSPWRIKVDSPKNLSKRFYEFALEWSPDRMDFFIDSVRVFSYTNKKILHKYFNQGMWIVVNNSIWDQIGENLEYYSEFEVDYVRAYTSIKK